MADILGPKTGSFVEALNMSIESGPKLERREDTAAGFRFPRSGEELSKDQPDKSAISPPGATTVTGKDKMGPKVAIIGK